MADENTLGELVVPIGADTSALDAAAPKVKQTLNDIASSAASAFAKTTAEIAGAALSLGYSFDKVVGSIEGVIEAGEGLNLLSQTLGISVDALARLEYAASTAGVGIDQITNAVKHLADLVVQHGPFEQGTLLFSQLGIAVKGTNGQFLDANTIFLEVADKLAVMTNGVQKTDLANQIFGTRIGAQLLPLLNQGAAGIKALGDQGVLTGGVLSVDLVSKLAAFQEQMNVTWAEVKTFAITLTADVLPALKFLATTFDQSSAGGLGLQIVALALAELFKVLLVAIDGVVRGIAGIGIIAVTTAKTLNDAAHGDFKAAWDEIQKGVQTISDGIHSWGDDTRKIFGNSSDAGKQFAKDMQQSIAPPIIKSAEDIKNALTNMLANSGVDPATKIAAINDAFSKGRITLEEYNTDFNNIAKSFNEFAKGAAEDAISQNLLTAAQQMKVLNAAVTSGALGFRQYDKMATQVYQNQQSNLEDLATQTASTITAVFGQNKGAAIASAIINTAVGITKALSAYPPPYNFAMAALVAASGVAQLAAIKSTTQTGGGSSAGASTSTAASQAAATTPAAAAPQQTLNVVGINPNALFTGDAVRNLAGQFIQFQKDGGKVVIQ